MSKEMPNRPREHELETLSENAFRSALPASWTVTKPSGDYGVDFDVEVFEGQVATGLHFYVQLKATDSSKLTVKLATKTLDYWAQLDVPTVVILYSAHSLELRWEWNYLLKYPSETPSKSKTVHLPNLWAFDTSRAVLDELRGRRATKNPPGYLPVFLNLSGDGKMLGSASGAVEGALRRLPRRHEFLSPVRADPACLTIDIQLLEDRIQVRVHGLPMHTLTYGDLTDVDVPELIELVTGDVTASIGLQLFRIGLMDVGGQLIGQVVATCGILWKPRTAAEFALILIRTRQWDELLTLIRRTHLERESDSGTLAVTQINRNSRLVPLSVRRTIALEIEKQFVDRTGRSSALYNAGAFLRHDDFDRARELYEAAAHLNPAYKERGYWWSEQGSTFFHQNRMIEAERYYREALKMGYEQSRPLLADVLFRSGKYQEGLEEFAKSNSDPATTHPQWRLTQYAFSYLTGFFEITEQARKPDEAERLQSTVSMESKEGLLEVLGEDLLNWFALWAATHIERSEGRPTLPFVLGAAVSTLAMPVLWEEALRTAMESEPALVPDILACIKQYCRDEFLAFLVEDQFLRPESVRAIAWLLENSPEPTEPEFIVRDVDGNETCEK